MSDRRKRATPRVVYASVAAQPDNLGDIAIRQVALDFVRGPGTRYHVFVGAMPASYVAAFDLPPSTRTYETAVPFALRLAVDALRGRAALLVSPGPYTVGRRAADVKALLLSLLIRGLRARGGVAVGIGRALRGRSRLGLWAQRRLVAACDVWSFRDGHSADVLGAPVRVAPDLGFALGPGTGERRERSYLALSFRSDREVSDDWVRQLASQARASGLTPIFVTQVRRDEDQHRRLAELVGAQHCAWAQHTHSEQLRRVIDVYGRSAAVVSNRLHAAVFGLVGGAVPLPAVTTSPDKVVETVRRFSRLPQQLLAGEPSLTEALAELGTLQEASRDGVASARHELVALEEAVRAVLFPGSWPPEST